MYARIGKIVIEDLKLTAQLQCVNKKVLVSCGYLHQATKSLERSVGMSLQSKNIQGDMNTMPTYLNHHKSR